MSGYTTYKQVLFNGGSFVFMHGEFHKGMCFCYVMVLEWIQWVLDTALYSWVCRRKMAGNLKHEIRSYIKIRSKLGEKPMKIHETLQTVSQLNILHLMQFSDLNYLIRTRGTISNTLIIKQIMQQRISCFYPILDRLKKHVVCACAYFKQVLYE